MPSLVLSFDGEMVDKFEIVKPRTSIGRHSYHDIAIDNLAVSGDHAAIVRVGNSLILEDSGSTNGTLVNGTPVNKHPLKHGDVIEIGKYHLKFFDEKAAHAPPEHEKTVLIRSPFTGKQLDPETAPAFDTPTHIEPFPATLSLEIKAHRAQEPTVTQAQPAPPTLPHVALRVLTGKQAGAEIPLTKPLTSIGKKGIQVAVITRRHNGYFLNHLQGNFPIVNDAAITEKPCPLNTQDVIDFSGVRMRFLVKNYGSE
jgi:predicted component of type VI protein secretion system